MKVLTFICLLCVSICEGQSAKYPYPVSSVHLTLEDSVVRMSYMDVKPEKPNGRSVLLLHGKNFNGYYWKDVIAFLKDEGYRVIVPDQVGWGQSDKPNIHYSFNLLASNTKKLLDTIGVTKVNVVAHSMGGMLATRFAVLYPELVDKLIYENPIGLEDYQTFVPYRSITEQFAGEVKADYASLKKYQQSYYPEWKPEYEQYVQAQFEANQSPNINKSAWAGAVTYQMIYEQPVLYYFKYIRSPTLLIIGQADRTVVGKNLLDKETAAKHGNYPALGKWMKSQIPGSTLIELPGIGHIPHVQSLQAFQKHVLAFLRR
jgi:pimeloyl-ACP methyl ester carboxylesterase